ncbi:hypothetical protein [Kibdelosporangium philippinense]|uniref:hypothetical protein n=1 Tax=Kibdelosporangium philippinense TaxID=211113 RepID=UPI0036081453
MPGHDERDLACDEPQFDVPGNGGYVPLSFFASVCREDKGVPMSKVWVCGDGLGL